VAARRLEWIPVLGTAGLVDAQAAAALGDPAASDAVDRARALARRHGMAAALQPAGNIAATPPSTLAPTAGSG
jgi:hypothetical protein